MINIFFICLIAMVYTICFVMGFFFYVYNIHKKEKVFSLSKYSKWSLITCFAFIFTLPLFIILDRFKNHYFSNSSIDFQLFWQTKIIIAVLLYVNNMMIQKIYQAKGMKKLSSKFKSVCKCVLET